MIDILELDRKYYIRFKELGMTIDKELIARMVVLFSKGTVKMKNIVGMYVDKVYTDTFFDMTMIDYSYFHEDSKSTSFKNTESLVFIYYMAMAIDFTIDEIDEVMTSMDAEGFDSSVFEKMLSLNKNLSKEVKLWLKLR